MTLIQVNPRSSDPGSPGWTTEDVSISVTPWRGKAGAVRIESEVDLILPDTDVIEVLNGVWSRPFDLEPTGATWCWRIVIEARRLKFSLVRFVLVPDNGVGGQVNWGDLLDVNPDTLEVNDSPSRPIWDAELELLRERIRVIEELGGGETAQALDTHINSLTPHPAYENITDLALLVRNGLK